jgi:hypothetical protein
MGSRTASAFFAVTLAALGGAVALATTSSSNTDTHVRTASAPTITVQSATLGQPIPPGFLGLSMEFQGLAAYAGSDPRAVNPVFEELLRNLAPAQQFVLRVGGQSTERTWWPVPHMARPKWAQYTLTPGWMSVARSLAQANGLHLILGVNLEADSRQLASAEAQAIIGRIGSGAIEALELGNEPEQYGSFPWYQFPRGVHHFGRPRTYDFAAYLRDFSNVAQALKGDPLAGPSTGGPNWMARLPQFLAAEHVKVATLHRYPLKRCSKTSTVTIGQLLSTQAAAGLAASVSRYVGVAHSHHVPLRIDEMNAVSCGGQPGVSDTFGSALWALDALFSMARVGVDGVNVHTDPGVVNELFSAAQSGGRWQSQVRPEYYGMMMFAQAAPAGSRLLRITGAPGSGIRAWATRSSDGHIRATLINKNQSGSGLVRVSVPAASGAATVELLRAPGVRATSGVTIGGRSFGSETTTGTLPQAPQTTSVVPSGGVYTLKISAASAALLTIQAR